MRIFALLALVPACGAGTQPTSSDSLLRVDSGATSCADLASSARTEVEAALAGNVSCAVDADCETFAFSAKCFDSCTRARNKSGAAAIDAAKAHVNGAQCTRFEEQGCTLIVPPCAPPLAPRCVSGSCQ